MYANGQEIDYTIEYQLPKTTVWVPLTTYERPFAKSDKLDETLDYGTLTILNDALVELPPFTLVRITNSQNDDVQYFYTTSWAADATNMSGG